MAFPPAPTSTLQRQLTGTSDLLTAAVEASLADSPMFSSVGAGSTVTSASAAGAFEFRIAGITDPGVAGKQNQDDFFLFESEDRQTIMYDCCNLLTSSTMASANVSYVCSAGVFDGHGREMGQVAARIAKDTVRGLLTKPEILANLRGDPEPTIRQVFAAAHQAIENTFKSYYESQGWIVEKRDGYLVRYRTRGAAAMCVHGGSTATVFVILDGRRLLVSNVGDSTAIMAGLGAAGALRPMSEWEPLSSSAKQSGDFIPGLPQSTEFRDGAPSTGLTVCSEPLPISTKLTTIPGDLISSYMELSADHSPESHTEFMRMHKYRPHTSVPHNPELLFVYDTLTASKLTCPPIFEVSPVTGAASKTEKGSYYKNVRCEWATLVATPPHAHFQDALAFTRSLGDLHLQTYGVSHVPESWWMDLTAPKAVASGVVQVPIVSHPLALVMCSDGIWDNWKFEEVAAFSLNPARVALTVRQGSSHQATNELMAANMERAKANFGPSADNMTAIILYMFPTA